MKKVNRNPFTQTPYHPVPVKSSSRYSKHFRKLADGHKAGATEFARYHAKGLKVNPDEQIFDAQIAIDENGEIQILDIHQADETHFENFDNDEHDVIFADDSDDVIFAPDAMIENPRVNRYPSRQNPAWLTTAATALGGLASATQIREHLNKQARRDSAKKRTTKKNPVGNVTELKAMVKARGGKLEISKKSAVYAIAKKSSGFSFGKSNRDGFVTLRLKKRTVTPKRNPHGDIYEEFTGLPSNKEAAMMVSHLAPAHLDKLGELVEVKLMDGSKLEFNPDSRTHHVWLCAANKKQLWITGTSITAPNDSLGSHEIAEIGVIDKIVYRAFKPVVGDSKPEYYIHELGEDSGEKPILAADRDGMPIIHGGNYSIESRGIVD